MHGRELEKLVDESGLQKQVVFERAGYKRGHLYKIFKKESISVEEFERITKAIGEDPPEVLRRLAASKSDESRGQTPTESDEGSDGFPVPISNYIAEPILIPLSDTAKLEHFFGISADTARRWHEEYGLPIRFIGEGQGRRGYLPVAQVKAWLTNSGLFKLNSDAKAKRRGK